MDAAIVAPRVSQDISGQILNHVFVAAARELRPFTSRLLLLGAVPGHDVPTLGQFLNNVFVAAAMHHWPRLFLLVAVPE